MAFFLIGRGPEDDLHLLSTAPLASRHDAMAELSRLSSSPDFDHWDSDVFVIDLDSGIPVLLVRPAAASQEATESIVDEAPEPVVVVSAAEAWLADVPAAFAAAPLPDVAMPSERASEAEQVPTAAEVATEESLEPSVEAQAPEAEAFAVHDEDAAIAEEADEVVSGAEPGAVTTAEEEPAEETVAGRAFSEELGEALTLAETEPVGDPAIADEIVSQSRSEGEWDSLRGAIERTTVAMAAEGVIAPASVDVGGQDESPADIAAQSEAEPEVSPAEKVEVRESAAVVAAETDAAEASAETAAAWPWDVAPEEQPTASDASPDLAFVYSTLEEPVHSDADEISATIEDLGEVELAATIGSSGESGTLSVAAAPAVVAHSPMSSLGEIVGPGDDSDFIDLEEVAPDVALVPENEADLAEGPDPLSETAEAAGEPAEDLAETPERPGFSAAANADKMLVDYSCDDCVYVETCPNKDQRLPKDCGSFQWK